MKGVKIVSANFGSMDHEHFHAEQNYPCSFVKYDENSSPYPFPNLDNRTRSKYFKMQMHTLLEYDAFIWVDASIQILTSDFVSMIMRHLDSGYDMVVYTHPQRKSVFAEIDYIIHNMRKGDHYLISRYGHQKLSLEKEFFEKEGYPNNDVPLFFGCCFAVTNDKKCNMAFDEWWQRSLQFSNFDQNFLSYIIWKHKLRAKQLPDFDGMITRHKHIQKDEY